MKVSRCVAASYVSTVYPAENALFTVVHGGRRHFLIPHKPLLFQILQFLLDFDRKSAVLMSRFSKCPECFSMREISPRVRETRDFSSNAGDLAGILSLYLSNASVRSSPPKSSFKPCPSKGRTGNLGPGGIFLNGYNSTSW